MPSAKCPSVQRSRRVAAPRPSGGVAGRDDAASQGVATHGEGGHRGAGRVVQAGVIGAPVSYARATYHAVHTFVVIAPDGTRRYVRFTWQPVAGVRTTDPTTPPVDNYLHRELDERLRKWPAEFILMMTVGETGDAAARSVKPAQYVQKC